MGLKCAIVPVTAYQQNCSILMCDETKQAAVVDPGGDLDRIEAQLDAMGGKLSKIFLTHGHMDHSAAADVLRQKYAIEIEGPERKDNFWIMQLPQMCAQVNFPPAEPFVPNRWLNDGDVVEVGNLSLNVVYCPGHTPGHVVFISEQERLAFVGDVLFKGSIGRTDFPMSNHQDLINSITDKLWPLGDDIRFVPGHGPMSTFGEERRSNPFVADPAYR